MKASAYIKELQALIETHGDLEVEIWNEHSHSYLPVRPWKHPNVFHFEPDGSVSLNRVPPFST